MTTRRELRADRQRSTSHRRIERTAAAIASAAVAVALGFASIAPAQAEEIDEVATSDVQLTADADAITDADPDVDADAPASAVADEDADPVVEEPDAAPAVPTTVEPVSEDGGLAETDGPSTTVRTISGTVVFDERTTAAQRESVVIGATRVSDDETVDGIPVDTSNIAYAPSTGAFSLVNLEPGEYKLGIVLYGTDSFYYAGTEPSTSWDDWGVSDDGVIVSTTVDVTEADQTGVIRYFDRAAGGINVFVQQGRDEPAAVIATNVDTGEESELAFIGRCSLEGCTWSGLFETSSRVTLRAEVAGSIAYYDGNEFAASDAAEAAVLTMGLWDWQFIVLDNTTQYVLGANGEKLVDGTRGDVVVPTSAHEGDKVYVFVGVSWAGQTVHAWMHSTLTDLGAAIVDENGYASFALPSGISGDHRIAVVSPFVGLLGWGNIAIAAAGGETAPSTGDTDGVAGTGAAQTGAAQVITASELARTGSDAPVELLGIGSLLLLVAGATLFAARRRVRAND